jgi:hypothetical protein
LKNPSRLSNKAKAAGAVVALALALLGNAALAAGVSVSSSGTPTYGIALKMPPGIAGMTPNLGLSYTGGGVNGPVGYGWTIQGISTITRCPGTVVTDGAIIGVTYAPTDKLCLDGQRLIQTDANGNPLAANAAANGALTDAIGLASTAYTEYRTEKDTYARIRAYGAALGNISAGPAYFQVWTKSGQIYEYGASPHADANTNALIPAQGKSIPMAWAVSRISDTLGNYIDFKYIQRDTAWGSGPGPAQLGREWNLAEVQYTGHGSQVPTNKVVFDYADRADNPGGPQDRAEAYQQGSKNVSISRLRAVRTYVNWPGPALGVTAQGTSFPSVPASPTSAGVVVTPPSTAVKVSTLKIGYTLGTNTGRSLVTSITECAGAAETECQPATTFSYTPGGGQAFGANAAFASSSLATTKMMDATSGNYGVVLGDFTGDGKTDILRWGNTPSDNQLWLSNGDGTFKAATGFNLTTQKLFSNDGCYSSIVADFNADGVSDILRTVNTVNASGGSCPTDSNLLFLGNGDGSFRLAVTLPTSIDLSSVKEVITQTKLASCIPFVVKRPATGVSSAGAVPNTTGNTCYLTTKTTGKAFFLLDVNGDGILDIVTTIDPGYTNDPRTGDPIPTPDQQCASTICTHVYIGTATAGGTMVNYAEATGTNLAHHSVYTDPPTPGAYSAFVAPATVDFDGDGLTDLVVNTGSWRSSGDSNGDFTLVTDGSSCASPIDFNGDGRPDCLNTGNETLWVMTGNPVNSVLGSVSGFNLTLAGQPLWGTNSGNNQQSIGTLISDFSGDGRSDILRWEDSPASNALYLSNGDGTFRTSSAFNLTGANQGLRNSDGKTSYLAGDFTGHGALEILRMKDSPTAGSEGTTNQIYARTDESPADLLQQVTSPTGLKTKLTYVPLTNSASGTIGTRYTAGTVVTYPKVNVAAPMYVVATVTTDTGVSGTSPSTVNTEYTYQGLRAHLLGRGLLGFAQTSQQSLGPNGDPLTITTSYLQDQPYIGVASVSQTYNAGIGASSPPSLSRTTNAYCDLTSTTAPGTITTGGSAPAACTTTALVQRPYLSQTLEEGWDLGKNPLPTVTTTNTYTASADPKTIAVTTKGSAAGVSQTFTKTTTNIYNPDVTGCTAIQTCSWILGRLSQSSVASTVPNSLPSIATSAGNGAYATATSGSGAVPKPPPPPSPAVLSAILSLLMSD